MDEVVWRLLGAKRAHEGAARVSDLAGGPLGLASRARRLEDQKIRRSEVRKIRRSEVQKIRKDRMLLDLTRPGPKAWRIYNYAVCTCISFLTCVGIYYIFVLFLIVGVNIGPRQKSMPIAWYSVSQQSKTTTNVSLHFYYQSRLFVVIRCLRSCLHMFP